MNFIGILMCNGICEVNQQHHIIGEHGSVETITDHPMSWPHRKYCLLVLVPLRDILKIGFVFCYFYNTRTQNQASQMWVLRETSHSRTATVPQTDHEPRERSSWTPARPDWGRTGKAASRGQKSPTQLRQFSPTEQACMKWVTQTGRHHLWGKR